MVSEEACWIVGVSTAITVVLLAVFMIQHLDPRSVPLVKGATTTKHWHAYTGVSPGYASNVLWSMAFGVHSGWPCTELTIITEHAGVPGSLKRSSGPAML